MRYKKRSENGKYRKMLFNFFSLSWKMIDVLITIPFSRLSPFSGFFF